MSLAINALLSELAPDLAKKVRDAQALKQAIGDALTQQQQLAVSPKIIDGPYQFIDWLKTDMGRNALRELVDKFAAPEEKQSPSK